MSIFFHECQIKNHLKRKLTFKHSFFLASQVCNTTLCDCKGLKGKLGHQGPAGFPGPEGNVLDSNSSR